MNRNGKELNDSNKKRSATITNFCSVNVSIPHNERGVEILSGTCELEGCHIKGEELQFIMTKSNLEDEENNSYKELKVEQYIVGLDKHFK